MLSDDGDMLWVQAEHMPGDHWWVAVSGVRFDEYRKSSPGRKSAAAIVRIAGSAGLLLYCGVTKVDRMLAGARPSRASQPSTRLSRGRPRPRVSRAAPARETHASQMPLFSSKEVKFM